jgi:hypothetical protein
MLTDSQNTAPDPGDTPGKNRDNSREIPVNASGRCQGADLAARDARRADCALDLVADAFFVHRALFDDPPAKRSAITWPRQVAIALLVSAGLNRHAAGRAIGVDFSTVKLAVAAVDRRKSADPAFAADFAAWSIELERRAGVS